MADSTSLCTPMPSNDFAPTEVVPVQLGMVIQVCVSDTRPNRDEHGHDFLPAGETRTQLEPSQVWARVFFPAHG
jgi:hypothetical protein